MSTRDISTPRPVRPLARRLRITTPREVLVSLGLAVLAAIWIYPFLWMVSASLKSNADVFAGLGLRTQVLHLNNYVRAWKTAHIGRYFLNTVLITAGSIVISVASVSMMGYVLGRYRFPGRRVVLGVFAAAVFLPEGYTIIPIFDLIARLHLQSSLWGITLAEAGGAHIVATLLFAGYFSQLPKELEEAATIDGAGFARIFFRIYLPLAKPVVATAIILQFMQSWNDFLLPLVMTLSRPNLRTLSVGLYSFQGDNFTDWSGMAAAATIGLIPIIVVFLVLQRYFVEGIAGAVKD